jgi:hypothetical protein
MTNISNYIKARKIAVLITITILIIGSIIYFSTNVAKRNNEMMYKEIYGKNATIKNVVDDVNIVNGDDAIQNVKTALA